MANVAEWEAEVRRLEKEKGPGHLDVASALQALAEGLRDEGDEAGERKALERALAAFSFHVGMDDPRVVSVRQRLSALGPRLSARGARPDDDGRAADGSSSGLALSAAARDSSAINSLAAALSERWGRLPAERKEAVFAAKDAKDREAIEATIEELREDRASLNRQLRESTAVHARRVMVLEERHRAEAEEAEAEVARLEEALAAARRRGVSTPRQRAEVKELRKALEDSRASFKRKLKRAKDDAARERARADEAEERAGALGEEKRRLEARVAALKKAGPTPTSDAAVLGRVLEAHLGTLRAAAASLRESAERGRTDGEARVAGMEARAAELGEAMSSLTQSAAAMRERAEALHARLEAAEREGREGRDRLERELEEARAAQREADKRLLMKTHEWKMQEARLGETRAVLEAQNDLLGDQLAKLVNELEEMESSYLAMRASLVEAYATAGTQTRASGGLAPRPKTPRSRVPGDVRPPWVSSQRVDA